MNNENLQMMDCFKDNVIVLSNLSQVLNNVINKLSENDDLFNLTNEEYNVDELVNKEINNYFTKKEV